METATRRTSEGSRPARLVARASRLRISARLAAMASCGDKDSTFLRYFLSVFRMPVAVAAFGPVGAITRYFSNIAIASGSFP